ncbi:MAG: acyltransferase family protein [Chloroflexota bacterium]
MIRRFLLLNGLATLGVVLNHAVPWGFVAMFWWTHRYLPVEVPNFDQMGSATYYVLRLIEQLIMFSIPAFLFVSGFFVSVTTGRKQTTVAPRMVGNRLLYLVIPYLLWSILIFFGDFLQGEMHAVDGYLVRLATGGATAAYYYVPLLCQLYLLSLLLVPAARARPGLLLGITAVIQLTIQTIIYLDTLGLSLPALLLGLTPSWFFPGHLFWFTAGIVIGFHTKAFQQFIGRIRWGMLTAVIILFIVGVVEWELILGYSEAEWLNPRNTIIDSFYAIAFIFSFLAFDKFALPFSKGLSDIGGKSYGVYLAHMPVLEFTARGIYHLLPALLAYQLLMQPLLIIVGLGVPLLLMALVNAPWSPLRPYYRYIFG